MVLEAEAQSGVNDYEKDSDVYGSQGKEAETLGKELESIYQASPSALSFVGMLSNKPIVMRSRLFILAIYAGVGSLHSKGIIWIGT